MNIIIFQKAHAEHFIDCLKNGKPIEPVRPEGWSYNDMLVLAGACCYGALSYGPMSYQRAYDRDPSAIQAALEKLPKEHREAIEDTWYHDLAAAIEYYGHLSMNIENGKYDEHWGPHVVALVSQVGELERKVVAVKGFRGPGRRKAMEQLEALAQPPVCFFQYGESGPVLSTPDDVSLCVWTQEAKAKRSMQASDLDSAEWILRVLESKEAFAEFLRSAQQDTAIEAVVVDLEAIEPGDFTCLSIPMILKMLEAE